MWIVFGTQVKTMRVPGGARVDRHCDQCGEHATFYEKEVTSTFRLYFIDVFDYKRHRVMACGCCGACYATDELGMPNTPRLNEEPAVARSLRASGRRGRVRHQQPVRRRAPRARGREAGEARRAAPEEELDPLEHPMEARFRELERKAGLRIK